jgi:hypothetical protein
LRSSQASHVLSMFSLSLRMSLYKHTKTTTDRRLALKQTTDSARGYGMQPVQAASPFYCNTKDLFVMWRAVEIPTWANRRGLEPDEAGMTP